MRTVPKNPTRRVAGPAPRARLEEWPASETPWCLACHSPAGPPSHVDGERKCCPDCDHRPLCWTCGAEMEPEEWRMAPREPRRHEYLRVCRGCHDVIEFLPGDRPRLVANMIRHAAGVPTVPPIETPAELVSTPAEDRVVDLMAALEESVAAAKAARAEVRRQREATPDGR